MCGEAMSSRKQLARQRRNLGERFARDERRCELPGDRYGDLDGFAFEARLDRLQRVGRGSEVFADAFERGRGAAVRLDLGFGLGVGVAFAMGLGKLHRVLGERDRRLGRLAVGAAGEVDVEQEFCRSAHGCAPG